LIKIFERKMDMKGLVIILIWGFCVIFAGCSGTYDFFSFAPKFDGWQMFALMPMPISVYPLATNENAVFDDALIGKWVMMDTDVPVGWSIIYEGGDSYVLRWMFFSYEALLVEVGDFRFLDISIIDNDKEQSLQQQLSSFYKLPLHSFMMIEMSGDEMKVVPVDYESVRYLLDNDPNYISTPYLYSHSDEIGERLILTAQAEQLENLVLGLPKIWEAEDSTVKLQKNSTFISESDIVFDESLVGLIFKDKYRIESFEDVAYKIELKDEIEGTYYFCIVKSGDTRLMAFFWHLDVPTDDDYPFELVPDFFAEFEVVDDKLDFKHMSFNKAKEILSKESVKITEKD
jgi:hypothetical protein